MPAGLKQGYIIRHKITNFKPIKMKIKAEHSLLCCFSVLAHVVSVIVYYNLICFRILSHFAKEQVLLTEG